MNVKKILTYVAIYEVAAYLVNMYSYQSALAGGGGLGFTMPLDFIGSIVGYGSSTARVASAGVPAGSPGLASTGGSATLNNAVTNLVTGATGLSGYRMH
jgi:hypothetical protein